MVAQKELLERIVRGDRLAEILLAIVAVLEEQSSTRSVITIMPVDRENNCLRNAASRKLPPSYLDSVEVLKQVIDQPKKSAPLIAVMERQTAQIMRLIDDLIDVSRIPPGEAGTPEPGHRPQGRGRSGHGSGAATHGNARPCAENLAAG